MTEIGIQPRTEIDAEITLAAQTLPQLSGAAAERVVQSLIDGLAVAVMPFVVEYNPPFGPEETASVDGRPINYQIMSAARLNLPTKWVWCFPASDAASGIRSQVITVVNVSYSNPVKLTAALKAGNPNSVAEALKTLVTLRSTRRSEAAKAQREQLETIVEEALFDATVDERFYLKERARVEHGIFEEQLAQERLKTQSAALQLAQDVAAASEQLRARGMEVPFPQSHNAAADVLDNARLVGSFEVLDQLDLHVDITEPE